jgi:O-antigen/teichoic acid export membrane protein
MALILAVSVPLSVVQRTLLTAFEIRLETYLSNKVMTASSVLTLLGGFYFLKGRYDVVGYFGYSQIMVLCATLACYWLAAKRYGYRFSRLVRHLRLDRDVYTKIKDLSYTGMLLMVFWVLFYELDQIVIAHYFGASSVAVFAIAASISSYLRVGLGSVYSPFLARANQYIGSGDADGLQGMIDRVMTLFTPVVVFLCIIIAAFAKPFILSWVGEKYDSSVYLVQLLALQFSLSVVFYPVGVILVAKVETKKLRYVSLLQPIGYWLIVISLMQARGIAVFVEARAAVLLATFVYYLVILKEFFGIGIGGFLKRYFLSIAITGAVLGLAAISLSFVLPAHKSKSALLIIMGCGGIIFIGAILFQYGTQRKFRNAAENIFPKIRSRKVLDEVRA